MVKYISRKAKFVKHSSFVGGHWPSGLITHTTHTCCLPELAFKGERYQHNIPHQLPHPLPRLYSVAPPWCAQWVSSPMQSTGARILCSTHRDLDHTLLWLRLPDALEANLLMGRQGTDSLHLNKSATRQLLRPDCQAARGFLTLLQPSTTCIYIHTPPHTQTHAHTYLHAQTYRPHISKSTLCIYIYIRRHKHREIGTAHTQTHRHACTTCAHIETNTNTITYTHTFWIPTGAHSFSCSGHCPFC